MASREGAGHFPPLTNWEKGEMSYGTKMDAKNVRIEGIVRGQMSGGGYVQVKIQMCYTQSWMTWVSRTQDVVDKSK